MNRYETEDVFLFSVFGFFGVMFILLIACAVYESNKESAFREDCARSGGIGLIDGSTMTCMKSDSVIPVVPRS